MHKSFDRPFLKGRRVLGQRPEARSAEREISLIRPKSDPHQTKFGDALRASERAAARASSFTFDLVFV